MVGQCLTESGSSPPPIIIGSLESIVHLLPIDPSFMISYARNALSFVNLSVKDQISPDTGRNHAEVVNPSGALSLARDNSMF